MIRPTAFVLLACAVAAAAALPTDPSTVTDLAVIAVGETTVTLQWKAPRKDQGVANSGPVTSYDIRYSTLLITDSLPGLLSDFEKQPQAPPPTPAAPGTQEQVTITGLLPDTRYYFAIKSIDEFAQVIAMSNVPSGKTLKPDVTPPGTVTDLAIIAVTDSSLTLRWTEAGDDGSSGTAARIDLRISTSLIDDANFSLATPVTPPPTSVGGFVQVFTVDGLPSATAHYVAVKYVDDRDLVGGLSNVPFGSTLPKDTTNHGGGDSPCGGSATGAGTFAALALVLLLPLALHLSANLKS